MHERWLILAVLTIARTDMGFQFQSVAAVSQHLIGRFDLSFAALGILIGLYLFPGVAVAIPGGMLAQRFGDKRIICAGLAAMTLGGALMGTSDSIAVFTVGRILSGAGGVFVNVLVTKMLTDWFAGHEITTAFGILVISWPLGIAAALVALPPIVEASSWSAAMYGPAAASALTLALVASVYRTPTAVAVQPVGRLRFDLTHREFLLITFAGLIWTFYNVAFIIIPAFGPAFTVSSGQSAAAAGAIVSAMTWVVIPAVPFSAWLAERTGHMNLVMHASFLLAAVAIALLASFGPAIALFALIGLFFAPPGGLVMTLPGEVVRPEKRALAMGLYFTWYYAGMGLLPGFAGYMRDLIGNAAMPLWFAAAMAFAASLMLLQFRRAQRGTL